MGFSEAQICRKTAGMSHPLDRPIWNALATRQRSLAEGGGRARRYHPDYTPFGAAAEDSPNCLVALARLVPQEGPLVLLQAGESPVPPGTVAAKIALGVQMLLGSLAQPRPVEAAIERLSEGDAPAMRALAKLTEPGPFCDRTHQLGSFFGIRQSGMLVAMAGERMKIDGYSEVSGVATHPDFRGRGYAGALTAHVAAHILESGETPFLHAYATNAGAIALYERLGFAIRTEVVVTVLVRAER